MNVHDSILDNEYFPKTMMISLRRRQFFLQGWVRRKIGTRFPSPAMVLSGTTCLSVLCVVLIDVQQNLYISRDGARPSSSGENELLVGGSNWPAGVWWEHTALKSWQVRVVCSH